MGGPLPLGYDVENRRLVVNSTEADLVRQIYQRYLELGSVVELADDLNVKGYKTKVQQKASGPHRGGCAFRRGTLYHLLSNPIYRGKIVHKGEVYPGEHEAIVPEDLFQAVQDKLKANASGTSRRLKGQQPSLLTGILQDSDGRAMTPSHASKGKAQRYRYYVTRSDQTKDEPAYVAHSLEASLWSVARSGTFAEAVLLAANLGEDADTTAAITGQLAGGLHGASAIPKRWLERQAWNTYMVEIADQLFEYE